MIENPELLQFLRNEEAQAIDTSLNDQIAVAVSMYLGEPLGDEVEGRSTLVTREVAQAVDYDQVGILKTVISADRIVQFESQDMTSKEHADDASALIHYQFMRKQDGYGLLRDWIKSGEVEKTGVVKSWIERPTKDAVVEVPEEAFQPGEDGGLTIDGHRIVGEPEHLNADEVVEDEYGQTIPAPAVYRATVRQPLPPVFKDAVVPNGEFGASPDARDLESAPYLYHVQQKTLSQLREMGFEFEDDALWSSNNESQVIADARDSQRSKNDGDSVRRGPMRKVWFREEYAFYDYDGDGIAERIFVQRVGGTIFTVQTLDDEQPFEEWCPYPQPGRRIGQSLADKVMDVQVVNSTLLRQAMNSLYLSTNPRTLVHEDSMGDSTIDDLLTVRPGMLIRYKGINAPAPWATIPVHDQAFQGMQQMTDQLESRTGISRLNQGLDADVFDRSGVAINAMQTAGQQMQESRARNFVEAVRRLFAKKYRMMRKYGTPVMLMVDGQPKQIDPRQWPEEIDIRVNVGLGTGNKDKRLALLQQAIEATSNGMADHPEIFTTENLYNLTREWYQNASLGLPSDFVTSPNPDPNAPPKPPEQPPVDPAVLKVQSDTQLAQQKQQADSQEVMAKLQLQQQAQQASDALKAQQAEQDLQAKRERTSLDMQLAREKASFEAQLAQQTADREYALALQRMDRDYELKRQQAVTMGEGGLPNNRPGGNLAE